MDMTITLRQESNAQQLWALLRGNWRAMADAGKPLAVHVTEAKSKRSTQQNRRHWAVVTRIAENAWVDGRQHSKEVWHEHLSRMFGVCKEMTLPDGEVILARESTGDMDVESFNAFMTRIEVYAVEELGVEFTQ